MDPEAPRPPAPSFIPPPLPQSEPTPAPTVAPPIIPVFEPTPPPPELPPLPNPEPSPLKQIRTFQGDIAAALGQKKSSVVSLRQAEIARDKARDILAPALKDARAQQQQVQIRSQVESKGRKQTLLLLLGTIILLGLGGTGSWYAYTTYKTESALPVITKAANHFIVTEKTETLDAGFINRQALIDILVAREATATSTGALTLDLRLGRSDTSPLLSTQDFLTLIRASAPPSLVRSFDPFFMLGILGTIAGQTGTSTHPFLLIRLDSFENAFPGMLAWEKTLPINLLPLISPLGQAPALAPEAVFSDVTIKNKDARILKDTNGRTVFLYSFFNNDLLIITDNEDALRALITRLTTETLTR